VKPEPPILHPPPSAVPVKPKKRGNLAVYLVVGLCLITLVLLSAFKKRTPAITVQTEKATRRSLTEVVVANGKIQPVLQVTISPEVSGEITELAVTEGQFVHKGDLLLKINPDVYVAGLNQAKAGYESSLAGKTTATANLEKAETDYTRNKELFARKLLSESDFIGFKVARDVAEAQVESADDQVNVAKASVDNAQDLLNKTTIVAPLDGTVTTLNSQLGERVLGTVQNAGTIIMIISDLSRMEARVDIGEMDVVLIKPEQKVRLEVDAFKDKKFAGTVTQIANSSKGSGQAASAYSSSSQSQEATKFEVRIRINEKEDFRPGMSVTAEIETRYRTNALTVPLASVTTRLPKPPEKKTGSATNSISSATNNIAAPTNNVSASTNAVAAPNAVAADKKSKDAPPKLSEVVFVIEGDHVKMVPVTIGICDDNYWEITDGLTDGEEIVTGGYKAISRDLADGKKIAKGSVVADATP
jgi:HlyD family secretion protein